MKIPVAEPDITKADMAAVVHVLNSGWISGISPAVEQFETKFAASHDCKFGVATGSGTTALHLALATLGIKKGDEVIMPTFTMVACANAVRYLGAKPVFVDANPKTWCIDTSKIEEKVTEKTTAIMPVHIYGHPCDMSEILSIAKTHNLKVIEDCAEAHTAAYYLAGATASVGSFGDCGCFSFYANKIITTGEGGMIITNDAKLAEKAKWLRAHAFGKGGKHFWHEKLGYGYRMGGLQAALGFTQCSRMNYYAELHRRNARLYMNFLHGLKGSGRISYPVELGGCRNVYWMFGILINEEKFGVGRDAVAAALAKEGIETRTMFYPMHIQPPYKEKGEYPVAVRLSKTGLLLPSGNTLTQQQVYFVCEKLRGLTTEPEDILKREEENKNKTPFKDFEKDV